MARAQRGATPEEALAQLTPEQQLAAADVVRSRKSESSRILEAKMQARISVLKAVKAGVPVKVLCAQLGVGRARVYQMREDAEAYLAKG